MSRPPSPPTVPDAPPSRHIGESYSWRHPVPTIQKYLENKKQENKESEDYERRLAEYQKRKEEEDEADLAEQDQRDSSERDARAQDDMGGHDEDGRPPDKPQPHKRKGHGKKKTKGEMEKEEMMDQMNMNKVDPITRAKKGAKGERRVRDPTTGGIVFIKDADPKDFDPSTPATRPSNILTNPFPPPRPARLDYIRRKLQVLAAGSAIGLTVIWLFTAFGRGFWRWTKVSFVCGGLGAFFLTFLNFIDRNLQAEVDSIRNDMHRQRGQVYSPPTPESVEWLNNLIKLFWGLIDPAQFNAISDMVEDIMQQSLPGFVDAVRITDIGQGKNPLRILSIRALADEQDSAGWPKKHWINKGQKDVKTKDSTGEAMDLEDAGDYYNFEISFSYSSLDSTSPNSKEENIHLLIEFFLGAFDWFHLPIPIWVQIENIFGTARVRCQMIQEFPYIRNVTFALCGVPHVEVSAVPMSEKLPNVLDLPMISNFVDMAIAAGTAEFCAPKSMTLNLKDMLTGAALGDTTAMGCFVITIHYAEDLSSQDSNGKSDPYVVLAYAKFGKPLYSTRIILEDLNPVWEETAVLLLTMDEVRSKEELSAMLWDSDKRSADDLVGRVQIPISELMQEPNKMFRRTDSLMGFEDANDMSGHLHWSIGYFEKVPLQKKLERPLTKEEAKKAGTDAPAKTGPEMEMRPDDAAPNPAKKDLPPPPPDITRTRPDPDYPSGILNVTIHHAINVERQNLKGKDGEREGEAGQDTDEPSEQSDNLPSAYCEIIVNDDMVFKTRVKQYTRNPFYEAQVEVFCRDFNNTVIRVVMRDSRLREADPILGVVSMRAAEMFKDCSSNTGTWAITEGQGFGKINMSMGFRGVYTNLPRNMRGWSTGTLEVGDVQVELDDEERAAFPASGTSLKIRTTDISEILHKKEAEVHDQTMFWENEDLRIPIYSRYCSSVVFEMGSKFTVRTLIGKSPPEAIAVLWLQDLSDDVEQSVKIPIFTGDNLRILRQNAINDETAKHHNFKLVGWMTVVLKLSSGLDLDHERLKASLSSARRHALEAFNRVEGDAQIAEKNSHAMDDGVIDKKEQKAIDKMHEKQLLARGRGMAQLQPYRTAVWMKNGLKSRLLPNHTKSREPTVLTE